ncbi:Ca2+-dependent phosphoinositide-specific phospholipase C [Pleomorphovibrio marinus]|uniref:Ca2+-dependent phosphoinositide-specific phospholipase C n=1 Tax=Pleomorphovibrio marinus TaxID=2164132 RepID=UPI000E0A0F5F|nr:Ca2+-dependent phosphoinositide-specific phospholipase C [Pleomorphovibrio marinus]
MKYFVLVGLLLFNWSACKSVDEKKDKTELKLNQIQLIGSHNSYKLPIQPELMQLLEEIQPEQARALDYGHFPIWEQLDMGIRVFELDVFDDPKGGQFAAPAGHLLLQEAGQEVLPLVEPHKWEEPGLKVMHVQDIDFRAHHATFTDYLMELKVWSEFHPNHLPVFISINAKDQTFPDKRFTPALPFGSEGLARIDKEIAAVFPEEKLLLPAQVKGEFETLEKAIKENAWPSLSDARGRFLFILDETGEKMNQYIALDSSFQSQRMFVIPEPGHPLSGILFLNDPVAQEEDISEWVKRGYMVRTLADSETKEARDNDTLRREKAFSSGAQLVSTDYYVPDSRFSSYAVRFPGNNFKRPNPLTASQKSSNKLDEPVPEGLVGVSAESFKWAMENGMGRILDVRTVEELKEGVIGEVEHLDFMGEDFEKGLADLSKEGPFLVYCKVGGRSEKAGKKMLEMGFERVYHLEGGIDKWKEKGIGVVPYRNNQ